MKYFTHRTIFTTLMVAIATVALITDNGVAGRANGFTYKSKEIHPSDGLRGILITNEHGDISIAGFSRDSIEIVAQKTIYARDRENADKAAGDVSIIVDKEGNYLRVRAKVPRRESTGSFMLSLLGKKGVRIDYSIKLPAHLDVKSRLTSGDFSLRDVKSDISAETSSGDVSVRDVGGDVTVHCSSGDSNLKDVTGNIQVQCTSGDLEIHEVIGDVDCNLTSGDVNLKDIQGDITVNAVSGDVSVMNMNGNLTTQSSSGDISVKGRVCGAAGCSITSSSGDVRLLLPASISYRIELETVSGKIRCTLPLVVEKAGRKVLRGRVGDGDIPLIVETVSGDITLNSFK